MRLLLFSFVAFFTNISFAGDNVSYDDLKLLVKQNREELTTLRGAVAKLQRNIGTKTQALREQNHLICSLRRENNQLSAYIRIYKEKIVQLEKIIAAQDLLKVERKNLDAEKNFMFERIVEALEKKIASCDGTILRLRNLLSIYAESEYCAACQGKIDNTYMVTAFR